MAKENENATIAERQALDAENRSLGLPREFPMPVRALANSSRELAELAIARLYLQPVIQLIDWSGDNASIADAARAALNRIQPPTEDCPGAGDALVDMLPRVFTVLVDSLKKSNKHRIPDSEEYGLLSGLNGSNVEGLVANRAKKTDIGKSIKLAANTLARE